MGVYVKLSGKKGATFRVTERVFPVVKDAQEYLRELGVDEKEKSRCYKVDDFWVFCSHPIKEIFKKDHLPDNEHVPRQVQLTLPKAPPAPQGKGSSKPKKTSTPAPAASGPTVSLKRICQELEMDPRKARQILRKKLGNTEGRWEWPTAEAEKIKSLLKE